MNNPYQKYLNYCMAVKVSGVVILLNFVLILLIVLLAHFLPDFFRAGFYSLIANIRNALIPNTTNINFFDKLIMILLLSIPSLVSIVVMAYFYVRGFKVTCEKCHCALLKHKKVLTSLIPPTKCPECGEELK